MKLFRNMIAKITTLMLCALIISTTLVRASSINNIVSDLAGDGTSGLSDGISLKASFNLPYGLALDKDGGIIIVDTNNNRIRKFKDNKITTIAGASDMLDNFNFPKGGYYDGLAKKAKFNKPRYAVVDSKGNIYISDTGNNVVRKISGSKVYTMAGNGKAGYHDGEAPEAMFNGPSGLAVDENDNIYVADSLNNVIRKITPQGSVSTFAGKWTENGGYRDGAALDSLFNEPSDLSFDNNENLYILDSGNQIVRKLIKDQVMTVCGYKSQPISGTSYAQGGYQDGYENDARFNFPKGITIADNGTIFIADTWNNLIRAINPNGKVITIAGDITAGYKNGSSKESRFNGPVDILYNSGNLYISDMWNNRIRIMHVNVDELPQVANDNNPAKNIRFYPKSSRVQLWLNGKYVNLSKEQLVSNGYNSLVSITAISKFWGAKTDWDKKTNKIKVTKGKLSYVFTTNKSPVSMNGGQPMASVKYISEKFGISTYWVPESNAIVLTSPKN